MSNKKNTIKRRHITAFLLGVSLLSLSACSPKPATEITVPNSQSVRSQTKNINDWFAQIYQEDLARAPLTQTYLGLSEGKNNLDDVSSAAQAEEIAIERSRLTYFQENFKIEQLDEQAKISHRLFKYNAHKAIENDKFRHHAYVFNHMEGAHSDFPNFMINFHSVKTLEDAQSYISRLSQTKRYFNQYQDRAETSFAKGTVLPKFVYAKLISASNNVIKGHPFSDDETANDSPILTDFKAKIKKLDISDEQKEKLTQQAVAALKTSVHPAYQNILAMFKRHQSKAGDQDGIWRLPQGDQYYQNRLSHFTTTDLSAEQIHQIGIKEVARIQDEMRVIIKKTGFKGSLQEFYHHLRTDPKFTFANNDQGRAQYMKQATKTIEDMRQKIEGLFTIKPKAGLVVKRVEAFRQDTAFGAFYESPALDGSRPGTYFINLKNVADQPKYLLQALAYHEGLPGHHMQIAIAQELQNIPDFRKQGFHTAYVEGWALYAESIPSELNLYSDPYSDFGRLSMEIFRAARLVVDTGIHAKKWSREQAVQYMLTNIASTEGDIRAEIDRYIVWPGQATAYKIGMLKIQELRRKAENALGDQFDIRSFHDTVLKNGSVPLSELEALIDDYIATEQQ